jgi:GTPase Era involved in 16S rRNA processing
LWWIPVTAAGGFVVKKIIEKKYNNSPTNQRSTLENNFFRLSNQLMWHRGKIVALIGQPGGGKSTLLNSLTEGQCSPKPFISQKTDATDWALNNHVSLIHSINEIDKDTAFIDTPGYGTSLHPLNSYIHFPFDAITNVIFVIRGKLQQADHEMFSLLISYGMQDRLIIVRTLSECLTEKERMAVKVDLNRNLRYKHINIPLLFVSNRNGEGISALKAYLL